MRIPVDTIPRTGRQVSLDLQTPWVREAASAALDAEPVSLTGGMDLSPPGRERKVTITARVDAAADTTCGRCGEPLRFALSTEATLDYVPAPADAAEEEVELVEEQLDVGWYAQGEIDLGDVLGEVIALALPPRYTCADSGDCDARTASLLAEAQKGEQTGHPGFAVLKKLTN